MTRTMPTRSSGHGTILVADDHPGLRNMARMVLEEQGFRVLLTNDGAEAIEVFRRFADEIVLAVLDVRMPRIDGEAALGELRRIRPDVPVLITCGTSLDEAELRFAGHPPSGFLGKPFRPTALAEKVSGLLAALRT